MRENQLIKVLHFSSEPVRGGAEEHMLLLLKMLDRRRFRPSLVCPPQLLESFGSDLPADVETTPLHLESPKQLGAAAAFVRTLLARKVDIVHSHMFRASLAASPIARLCGVPATVETGHGREYWRRGRIKGSYFIDRIAGRFVSQYIAVSKATGEYLVTEKRLPKEKITIIPNGCDTAKFHPAHPIPLELRSRLGFDATDPVLVVAARLEPQKGHRILLEALPAVVRQFPNVKVVCVGDGQLRAPLEEQSRSLGLAGTVHFAGYQVNVGDWLALADFTILPSFFEGLPLTAIESLAAGRAMVATAVDGTTEVVVDRVTGLLVPPGDATRLAEAINELLECPELRHTLAAAGRKWVESNFSQERQVRQTEELYLRALTASRRASGANRRAKVANRMKSEPQERKAGINMWSLGVPVATPVSAGDCMAAFKACFTLQSPRTEFEEDLRTLLGARFVRGTNSGRSALYFILEAMRQMSGRTEVVVPGFVCPSVGRAVIKAGLKLVLCDVAPGGSGFDLASLEQALTPDTLAVVPAHLFGYPFNVVPIMELAHAAGAMVIEDGAQAFGAKSNGQFAGTMADAGVFSFAMSKVLGSMGGGLVVTSNLELGRRVDDLLLACSAPSRFRQMLDVARLSALSVLVRSHHVAPLDAVWSRSIRGKNDCDDFLASACTASQAAIAQRLLPRLSGITRARNINASYFAERLAGFNQLSLPEVDPRSEPVFLRFPIVVGDPAVKQLLLSGLRAQGVNTSEMYTRESYESMRGLAARAPHCPRTEYLTERMLNLPTHAYMRAGDLDATVEVFHSVLGRNAAHLHRNRAVAAIY